MTTRYSFTEVYVLVFGGLGWAQGLAAHTATRYARTHVRAYYTCVQYCTIFGDVLILRPVLI